MKKLILAAALAALPISASAGDPSLFVGLSWTFGASTVTSVGGKGGFSVKVLSDDEVEKAALAAGMTYNFDGTFGCDAGLAYNTSGSGSLAATYDFCQSGFQFSVGGRTSSTEPAEPEIESEELLRPPPQGESENSL